MFHLTIIQTEAIAITDAKQPSSCSITIGNNVRAIQSKEGEADVVIIKCIVLSLCVLL